MRAPFWSGLLVAACASVAAILSPAPSRGASEPLPAELAQQPPAIRVMRLPLVGADTPSRFAIASPGEPAITCTRLGTFHAGQGWSGTLGSEPQRFTFRSNEREETAWRFAVFITESPSQDDGLVPLRSWLDLRYRATQAAGGAEGNVVSRPGGVVPAPAAGGGWVFDEYVRQPPLPVELMEVFACIDWGADSPLLLALDEDRQVFTAEPQDNVAVVASWRPSAGVALLDVDSVLALPGISGLLAAGGPAVDLVNPLAPPGSLAVQAFLADLPPAPEVRTLAIYTNTAPGRTTVAFELASPTGGYEPSIRCQGPLGEIQFQLTGRLRPGVPLPFVQHYSSPTISPNARPADFTCQQTAIRALALAPPQALVLSTVEDIVFNRGTGEYETLVGLSNRGAQPVSLSGWTVSAGLYIEEALVGFHEEPVDGVTLAPGEYRQIVVRQPAESRGFAPAAIGNAFRTPEGIASLHVTVTLVRRPG
jgi:hypothetical protein